MKWLITGGCGFIGTNLTRFLLSEGENVQLLDMNYPSDGIVSHPACKSAVFWRADLRHPGTTLWNSMQGVDVVVHLAAISGMQDCLKHPSSSFTTNVEATDRVLRTAQALGVPRFIFASSGAVCPETRMHKRGPTGTDYCRPLSLYGAQKAAAEMLVTGYGRQWSDSMTTCSLRFSNVYGPWSLHKNSAIHAFIQAGVSKRPLRVVGDGSQKRDFVHVADVSRAIKRAAEATIDSGSVYQIASGVHTHIKLAADYVAETIHGVQVETGCDGDPGPKNVNTSTLDARMHLNWSSNVELRDGIRDTVEWYKEHYIKKGA